MHKIGKIGLYTGVLAISLAPLSGCSAQNGMHPYAKTNQLRTQKAVRINHNVPKMGGRYGLRGSKFKKPKQYASRYDQFRGRKLLAYQQYAQQPEPLDMFQRWVDYEPQYLLYPGDQIDVVVSTAPELSRTLTVGPDGRITMPMSSPIMAAGRNLPYVQSQLKAELAKQLRDPTVAVTSRAFAPQQIFVGGQVGQQGTYTLAGPIGSLEAVIMAGGFLPSAKTKEVAILRRAPNGGLMIRTINHKMGMNNIRSYADNMQLRRGDIIFVPRSNISEIGLFVQQYFRDALPFEPSLSYNLGGGFSGN